MCRLNIRKKASSQFEFSWFASHLYVCVRVCVWCACMHANVHVDSHQWSLDEGALKLEQKDSVSSVCPPQDTELQGQRSICACCETEPLSLLVYLYLHPYTCCKAEAFAVSGWPFRPLVGLIKRKDVADWACRASSCSQRRSCNRPLSLPQHLTPPCLPVCQSESSCLAWLNVQ